MKKLLLSSLLGLIAASAFADVVQTPIIYTTGTVGTGATISLTGTAATNIPLATLSGSNQTFVLSSAKVIVLSATTVTAAPVVQLVSGTTVLSGTVAVTGSANYVTSLVISTPTPLILTGSTGTQLGLTLVTGGTATALNARVSVQGHYLE